MTAHRTIDFRPNEILVGAALERDGTCRYCGRSSCSGQHRTFSTVLYDLANAAHGRRDLDELAQLQAEIRDVEGTTDDTFLNAPPRTMPWAGGSSAPALGTAVRVEFRADRRSPIALRISETLLRHLRNERDTASWEGHEVSGFLFGVRGHREVKVTDYSSPSGEEPSTLTSTTPDRRRADLIARQLRPYAEGIVGDWHSHPGEPARSADGRPRPAELARDVEGWSAELGRTVDRWVGIVLTAHGFYAHAAHAYVARRDGGRIVVEPSEVIEVG